jgi:hypothetical protein
VIDYKYSEPGNAEFYNAYGSFLFGFEITSGKRTINTQNIPSGIYFLKISTTEQTRIVKVISMNR